MLTRFFDESILATREAVNVVADKFVPVTSPVTVSGEESVDGVVPLLYITKLFAPPVNPRLSAFVANPDPLYVNERPAEFPLLLLLPNLIGTEFVADDTTLRVTEPTPVAVLRALIPSETVEVRLMPFVVVEVESRPPFAEVSAEAVT